MSTELPYPPVPAHGAIEVGFPWAGAEVVVGALDVFKEALRVHADTRPGMVDTLVDWAGRFRDDFDETMGEIGTEVGYLNEDCGTATVRVADDAYDAADEQQQNNRDAQDQEASVRRNEERLI